MAPLSDANRLSICYPAIAKEWDAEKNDRSAADVSYGSKYAASWICNTCQFKWTARVYCRASQANGCPACVGRIVSDRNRLFVRYPNLALEWDVEKNVKNAADVSCGSNYAAAWKCSSCLFEWTAKVANRTINDSGCPACAGRIVSDRNRLSLRYPSLALEWDVEKNAKEATEVSYGSNYIASWKCSACQYLWTSTVANRTIQNNGCPSCAGQVVSNRNRLSLWYPDLACEWDVEKNAKNFADVSRGSKYCAWWKCRVCQYSWTAHVYRRTICGRGCPACAGKVASDRNRLSVCYPDIALEWDVEKNVKNVADVSYGSNYNASWKCSACQHSWAAQVNSRTTHSTGCPECSMRINISSTSKIEIVLAAEFAHVFHADDPTVKSTHRRVLGIDTEDSRAYDTIFDTSFSKRSLRPDICIQNAFSDAKFKLLLIEWDSAGCHAGYVFINRDAAKTLILQSEGHVVVRMREQPLEILEDVCGMCVSIEKTAHSDLVRVKRAVDVVLRHLLAKHGPEFTGAVRERMDSYLASDGVQNNAEAQNYMASAALAKFDAQMKE